MRRATIAVALAACAVALAGCVAEPPVIPEELVGVTLEQLDQAVGDRDDLTRLVQDVSVAVDLEPTFDGSQLDSGAWTIVAACADVADVRKASVLEVAVVPSDAFSPSVAGQVAAGDFDDTVTCKWSSE